MIRLFLETHSRFLWDHAFMYVSIHDQRVAWMVYIYYHSLVSSTLLRVGRRGGSSSHIVYTGPMVRLEYSRRVCFVLLGVFQTPWPLGKNLITLLCSLGFPFRFLMPDIYLEAVPKLSGNFLSLYFLRKLLSISFRPIFLLVSTLFPWLLTSLRSSTGGLFGLFVVPKRLPVFSAFRLFLKGLLRICEQCTGKSPPCLIFL